MYGENGRVDEQCDHLVQSKSRSAVAGVDKKDMSRQMLGHIALEHTGDHGFGVLTAVRRNDWIHIGTSDSCVQYKEVHEFSVFKIMPCLESKALMLIPPLMSMKANVQD